MAFAKQIAATAVTTQCPPRCLKSTDLEGLNTGPDMLDAALHVRRAPGSKQLLGGALAVSVPSFAF
eukprot:662594-Alexandrium_andersonii.AAC.1